MATPPTFVLFSGHNDRAVVALCRFFDQQALSFAIVAQGPRDAIWRTRWRRHVVLSRLDVRLDVALFAAVAQAVGTGETPAVICPTTEFMNQFLLDQRAAVEASGLVVPLPAAALYAQLTGKHSSLAVMQRLASLQPPPRQPDGHWHAPCVLKPRENVSGNKVLYPKLCLTDAALHAALPGLDEAQWFAQDWVEGQSHYLCAYLARNGDRAWYWQDNLLQQPGGKSMVLARSGANPGVDVDALFDGLAALGYHGPFMMELLRDAAGRLHYIEINPRFWGPLQLALAACPRLLTLFARDAGANLPDAPEPAPGPHWYAWAHGGSAPGCRHYPAAAPLEPLGPGHPLLRDHDVYAAADTAALQGCY